MFTQFTVGRENPMKPGQVGPWSGYQRRQAPHEFHWAEHDMGGAVIIGRLEGDDDVAVVSQGKASSRYGRSSDISAQALKFLALMRFTGDFGMQRKTCLSSDQVVALSRLGSHRHSL